MPTVLTAIRIRSTLHNWTRRSRIGEWWAPKKNLYTEYVRKVRPYLQNNIYICLLTSREVCLPPYKISMIWINNRIVPILLVAMSHYAVGQSPTAMFA